METWQIVVAFIPLLPVVALYINQVRSARTAGVEQGKLEARIEQLEKAAAGDAKTQEQLATLNVTIARLQEQVATLTEEVRRLRSVDPSPAAA